MANVLYLCDWLPPDFGAVGQYSLLFARERARAGDDVLLAGLSSTATTVEEYNEGAGRLVLQRLNAPMLDRSRFLHRLGWTLRTNLRLLWSVRKRLRCCDLVIFTGSPPFMLHLLAPLNLLLRRQLVYRITDFHPECLLAGFDRPPRALQLFYRLTVAWRRRVQHFEVLGEDQRRWLLDIGIPPERIQLKRDPAPVTIPVGIAPLERPAELQGKVVLLYSGNFGVAHDHETFVAGYRQHHRQGSGRVALWLNAIGAKADLVERQVREAGLPVHRSRPVPLDQLDRLLMTPDAHLITLRDPFVGFVMPSKVYGCVASGRDVLFVGSELSDVHLVCSEASLPNGAYQRVAMGDIAGVAAALETLAARASCRQGPVQPETAQGPESHVPTATDSGRDERGLTDTVAVN